MSALSDAVEVKRKTILAMDDPGKKEIGKMNEIVDVLLHFCWEADKAAHSVGTHLRNQDIEIIRLRKQVKKLRAVRQ